MATPNNNRFIFAAPASHRRDGRCLKYYWAHCSDRLSAIRQRSSNLGKILCITISCWVSHVMGLARTAVLDVDFAEGALATAKNEL